MARFHLSTRSVRSCSYCLIVASGLLVAHQDVRAASPNANHQEAEATVHEALHREIYGRNSDRQRLLEAAAKSAPDFGPARWHQGYVRNGAQWASVDSIIRTEETPIEMEYEARRAKAGNTVEDQLKLANWCRERKLDAQEQAHLTQILELAPDQPGIRERLGLQNVNGEWLTKDEALAVAEREKKEAEALAKWRTELRDIAVNLGQSHPERKAAARARLCAIRDRYAFPAMESNLSNRNEECAIAVVEAAAGCPSQEATDSLVRHALFGAWPLVREAAAERLRTRPRESFVPDLISEMYLPATSQFQWASLPNGRLGYRHMIRREGLDQRQELVLDTEYSRLARSGGNARETLQRAFLDSLIGVRNREIAVTQQNVSQSALNERLTETLNIATNQQLPADPQRWWQWWDEVNDIGRQGQKQTRTQHQVRQVAMADRRPQLQQTGWSGQLSTQRRRAECFAAGTRVLTRRGYREIEKIQPGDLVLSQHPETGELAFKPVLGTTIRPFGKLVKLTIGNETLETSQGHLFWMVGEGWQQSRKLQSGDALHCLNGSQAISSIDEGSESQTYNLVVADFHTYFVGEQRILSHDVTDRRPNTAVIPGLAVTE